MLVYVFLVGAVVTWLSALNVSSEGAPSAIVIAVAVTISAAGYWAVALVGQALLDVADSSLKA